MMNQQSPAIAMTELMLLKADSAFHRQRRRMESRYGLAHGIFFRA